MSEPLAWPGGEDFIAWLSAWAEDRLEPGYDPERYFQYEAEEVPEGSRHCDLIPQFMMLQYQDSDDVVSTRKTRISRLVISSKGYGLAQGYCFWRQMPRQFRIDRIEAVIDCDGVVHEDPPAFLLDLAHDFSVQAMSGTPLARFIREHQAELVLLTGLSLSDGYAHPAERRIIEDFAARAILHHAAPLNDHDHVALCKWLVSIKPSARDYRQAARHLIQLSAARRSQLLRAMTQVLEADDEIDEGEIEFIRRVTETPDT